MLVSKWAGLLKRQLRLYLTLSAACGHFNTEASHVYHSSKQSWDKKTIVCWAVVCSNHMLLSCIAPPLFASLKPVSTLHRCPLELCPIDLFASSYYRLYFLSANVNVSDFYLMYSFHLLCISVPTRLFLMALPDPLTHIPHKHMCSQSLLNHTWTLMHWNVRPHGPSKNYCCRFCMYWNTSCINVM